MKLADVDKVLQSNGFLKQNTSSLIISHEYALTLGKKWKILAYARREGKLLSKDVDPITIETVSFTLDSKGTKYVCHSLTGLKNNLNLIVQELTNISQNEELLKCPKCNMRYVHVKEPMEGQKWKPFLSCDGMVVVGRGAKKGVACSGVSNNLPVMINYE